MSEVLEPVTFELEIEGIKSDLVIPPEFIKDFYFRSDHHLMIMVRVVGRDSTKVRDFFQDTEGESFRLKAVYNSNQKIDDEFLLTDMHMDEGPSLGVDIDQEQGLVRLILDFKKI
ncbi:MAG: hypothetical protein ACXVHP_02295 [Methanobacterium sp.]